MVALLERWMDTARELVGRQPILALALGAALAAVFLAAAVGSRRQVDTDRGVGWAVFYASGRILWATLLLLLVGYAANALQGMLAQNEISFRHAHGRITEVNLAAVRTIWGDEQVQGELGLKLSYETEQTERIESEDLSRPALIRKSKKKIEITANPFIQARHAVTLRSNPRRKGSGVYAGYETDCTFNYRLKNPDGHEAAAVLRFPLPSRTAMYDNLVVRLDGQDVLSQVRMDGDAVVLERTLAGGQEIRFDVSFRSRGLSSWYFIVREPREIRDFLLTLTVANLPRSQWNNPQECMTPTALVSTPDGQGTVASYQLDHAIVSKGMGVALPRVEQPGEREVAVLGQICKGWVLMFATAVLMLIVGGARAGELSAVLIGAAVACAYGLVGNLYDTVLGFWPGAALVLVPLFVLLGLWVRRALAGRGGMLLALALPYFGAVYPLLAAMDEAHELLYMNLSATVFLAVAAWTLLVLRQGTVVRE